MPRWTHSGLRMASEMRNGRQLNGPMRITPSYPRDSASSPSPTLGMISPKIFGETCSDDAPLGVETAHALHE